MSERCIAYWEESLRENGAAEDVAGTPFYLYSSELLDETWRELQASLPPGAELLYSLKANPHSDIVRAFARHQARFDVASRGEMETLLATTGSLARAVWISPCKKEEDYCWAIGQGLGTSVIDSREEAAMAIRVHGGKEKSATEFLLRVQSRKTVPGGALWASAQFGLNLDESVALTAELRASGIVPAGLHGYFESNIFDADEIGRNTCELVELGRTWSERTGLPLRILDAGGGFGWPVEAMGPELSLGTLRDRLMDAAAGLPAKTKFWFESGRYLVAGAGALVLTVVSVKPRANVTLAILDGGMNVFGLPSMRLGFRPLTVLPLISEHRGGLQPHTLFGPLCTPGDKLCEAVLLPPLKAGDRLAILHAGAYGPTAARGTFLSFRPAREIIMAGERVTTCDLRLVLAGIVPHIESAALKLGPDESLPLDSMGMVSFAVALEDRFDVKFRPDQHDFVAIFSTLRSLQAFLTQERARAQ